MVAEPVASAARKLKGNRQGIERTARVRVTELPSSRAMSPIVTRVTHPLRCARLALPLQLINLLVGSSSARERDAYIPRNNWFTFSLERPASLYPCNGTIDSSAPTDTGERRTANGERRTANGERRTARIRANYKTER